MLTEILSFINKCEGWKVAIKGLHWGSKNLSQHKLCDDIASAISDFEDNVSEVSQSISGKLSPDKLKPKSYKVTSLKKFVEDVIKDSKSFLKELEKLGENYVGIKSDCESFISEMQRNLYLVNFTLHESRKNKKIKITENELKRLVTESINMVLNEIGDTKSGQFALGAVRGRAVARPRYNNYSYGSVNKRAEQERISNMAADEAWKNGDHSKEQDNYNNAGYYYGYQRGRSNY
jgi:vacuolar-type H+-ATPase subunit I/STV1